jgi:hypothetical protein
MRREDERATRSVIHSNALGGYGVPGPSRNRTPHLRASKSCRLALDVGRGAPKAGRAGAADRGKRPSPLAMAVIRAARAGAFDLSSSPCSFFPGPPARTPGGRKTVGSTYSADHGERKGVWGRCWEDGRRRRKE